MWELTPPQIKRMVYRHYRPNLKWWVHWLISPKYRRSVQTVCAMCQFYREPFWKAVEMFESETGLKINWPKPPVKDSTDA